jgi:hypothetical protein
MTLSEPSTKEKVFVALLDYVFVSKCFEGKVSLQNKFNVYG